MRRNLVIVGIAVTVAAFVALMSFDTQLSFIIFGAPQTGSNFPSGVGEGAISRFRSTSGQFFSTTYIRLSAYLVGLAGIVITSTGILLEPRRRKFDRENIDTRKDSPENRPVQVIDTSTSKSSGSSFPEEKHVLGLEGVRGKKNGRAIIKLESVVKTYSGKGVATPALNGVSLEIGEGELVAIVGPSGSGKSTLLNVIGALDKPTSGKVFIDDVDISKLNDKELAMLRNRKIGFIFQSFNLIHRMNALANVEFPLAARNIPPEQRRQTAQKMLQLVGLADKTTRTPSKLSGGEMQRVAVARALATEPAILLADEPTGNLDTKSTKVITEMLKQLNEKTGKTILMITHNMEVANATERIIYLRDGQIEREEFLNVRGAA